MNELRRAFALTEEHKVRPRPFSWSLLCSNGMNKQSDFVLCVLKLQSQNNQTGNLKK